MAKRYSFDEIMRMDAILLQLAIYETSKGNVFIPSTAEDLIQFQIKSGSMFNYFKRLIRNGETTFEELQDKVCERWGPIKQNVVDGKNIDKILQEIEIENKEKEIENKTIKQISDTIKNIFAKANYELIDPSQSNDPVLYKEQHTPYDDQVSELKKIGNPFSIPQSELKKDKENNITKKESTIAKNRYNDKNEKTKKSKNCRKSKSNH